jgi:phenylalanyl-tRNA synthetase alpha chain
LVVARTLCVSPSGEKAKGLLSSANFSRVFDVEAPVPKIFCGKKAPYIEFLQQIRSKLVALGFKEMDTRLAVTEFFNFDVLYQPQNHPARTWTDTYQLKCPKKGLLPEKRIVDAIKSAHEDGGKSGSKGWGYEWSEDIASRLMPAAHGTAHSARQLVGGIELPRKYFAIARCFRPDVLDATHLIEFNQMEGFIVGENLNFTHLLGMLKDFAINIAGAEKVKFFPDYYPFTEPSVQLSAKHPEMGWVEFAGAGMFRPEMLDNLGIKGEAIAWGMGVDRLAMFKLGIKDIRHLFSDDLNYLRNAKGVLI